MSSLMVEQLDNGDWLSQQVQITRDCLLTGIRVRILKRNPYVNGVVTFNLEIGSINETITLDYDFFNTNCPGTYWHGWVRLDFPSLANGIPLKRGDTNGDFEYLTLSMNYSGSANDARYYAWIRDENVKEEIIYIDENVLTGDESQDMWLNPYGIELITD